MADKLNVQVILPEMPPSASPEMRTWWQQVKYSLEQVLPLLIANVNDYKDGRNNRIQMDVLTSAPTSIVDGMVIFADGTSYDPGSGRGLYERVSSAWVKL
jgi:hypothetical protein